MILISPGMPVKDITAWAAVIGINDPVMAGDGTVDCHIVMIHEGVYDVLNFFIDFGAFCIFADCYNTPACKRLLLFV